ncbi:hypothetical protein B0J11DRAFT_439922 [Dendryphion nanum]|uniref:Uncharacterized protein n=1 Tax=Dendryphion nanum TaxID=256645 RepID=A0A9P9DHZ9_9PLEO|nr:hypothetical protein B0J11DRAFT_439922 [Dendryphion nanum]
MAAWYAWQQGRGKEAEVITKLSMAVRAKVLGKRHKETLSRMATVGLAGNLTGQEYEEAEKMNRQALVRREKALWKEHRETLTSVYFLAFLFHQQKQHELALELYRNASYGLKCVLGLPYSATMARFQHLSSLMKELEHTSYVLV